MKVLKDDIRERILDTAKACFLEKGYARTSMREIAEAAGVGLGNIYNYFPGKDAILTRILQPLTDSLDRMLVKHHGQDADVMLMMTDRYYLDCVNEYILLIKKYRKSMKILFFGTQGSCMEHYIENFSDRATGLTMEWFGRMGKLHAEMNSDVSAFTIHLHTVWMIVFLKEILMHDLDGPELERAMSEYIGFEINGWKQFVKEGKTWIY